MAAPKYDDLLEPLFKAMHELGGSASIEEQEDRVAALMELSEEELGDAHGGLLLPAVQKVTQKKKASTLGWKVNGFDGKGNYTLGLRDQLIFPEIDMSKVDLTKGMNVTVVTTADRDDHALALLEKLGFPFTRPQ